jgi:transcriptional regulator with XRE-family HTH domain
MRERPDLTNHRISRNIRLHRLAKGMTQAALGAGLGVSFQQVQKYESGASRVSSSRLLRIAQILEVDILSLLGATNGAKTIPLPESSTIDLFTEPQTLRLATMFASIEDASLRRSLVALTGHLARLSPRSRKKR